MWIDAQELYNHFNTYVMFAFVTKIFNIPFLVVACFKSVLYLHGQGLQAQYMLAFRDGRYWYFATRLLSWTNITIITIIVYLMKNTKCAMNCHLSDKINGNSVAILYDYQDYCRLQLLLIYENYTMPIIANKIITIFSIIE